MIGLFLPKYEWDLGSFLCQSNMEFDGNWNEERKVWREIEVFFQVMKYFKQWNTWDSRIYMGFQDGVFQVFVQILRGFARRNRLRDGIFKEWLKIYKKGGEKRKGDTCVYLSNSSSRGLVWSNSIINICTKCLWIIQFYSSHQVCIIASSGI